MNEVFEGQEVGVRQTWAECQEEFAHFWFTCGYVASPPAQTQVWVSDWFPNLLFSWLKLRSQYRAPDAQREHWCFGVKLWVMVRPQGTTHAVREPYTCVLTQTQARASKGNSHVCYTYSAPLPALKSSDTSTRYLGITVGGRQMHLPKGWGAGSAQLNSRSH